MVIPLGCGKPTEVPPAKVEGRVTFGGRPLAGGLIVFVPDVDKGSSGKMLTAGLAADGGYQLANGAPAVPSGWYRVAIAEPAETFGGSPFPPQLRRPDRSGLERQVKPGHDHRFDFDIELTR
jgi:hypothetical protein